MGLWFQLIRIMIYFLDLFNFADYNTYSYSPWEIIALEQVMMRCIILGENYVENYKMFIPKSTFKKFTRNLLNFLLVSNKCSNLKQSYQRRILIFYLLTQNTKSEIDGDYYYSSRRCKHSSVVRISTIPFVALPMDIHQTRQQIRFFVTSHWNI